MTRRTGSTLPRGHRSFLPRGGRFCAALASVGLLVGGWGLTGCADCSSKAVENDDAFRELAEDAVKIASKLRGLALPEGGVNHKVASKADVVAYIEKRIQDTGAEAIFRDQAHLLEDFGAHPEGVDLSAAFVKAAADQVAGFYDWETKTLYLADWIPSLIQKPIMIHEATHALQDHHFGLARFMEPMIGYGDPQAAVQALIEGDATLVMVDAMAEQTGMGREMVRDQVAGSGEQASAALGDAPPIIGAVLTFPYFTGLSYASALEADGGYPTIDKAYRKLPLSTEQVIHPEKASGDGIDYPRDVTFELPEALAKAGYTWATSDILGEFGVRFIIEQGQEKSVAQAAAAGWDGDRAVLLRHTSGATVSLLASVWDSEAEATEAAKALRGTKLPPVAVVQAGDRVVGLWGQRVANAEAIVGELANVMKLTEVFTYDYYVKASADAAAARKAASTPKTPAVAK